MKSQQGTFCTVFPNYRDFHFFKDPGQIPYRFSKLGYDVSVVCYGNDVDFHESEKYLKVIQIPDRYRTRKFNLGIVKYLLFHSRKIDILHTFHYSWSSLLSVFIYKTFNRRGFAYLKLDYCVFARSPSERDENRKNGTLSFSGTTAKSRIKNSVARKLFVRKVDLWSVEDSHSKEILEAENDYLKGKLVTVYNGHTSDLPGTVEFNGNKHKQDIILTAGRLGTIQKATDVLLDAFLSVANTTKYDLHLAGAVDPAFQAYLERFLHDNPSLQKRIVLHGSLGRDELYRLYCRSRIFCLPSRFEGMAIVFPEAMYYGNVIVTTEDVSIKPLIEKYRFGLMVKRDNAQALAGAIMTLINDRSLMDGMADRAREVSSTLLNWDDIVNGLRLEIKKRLDLRKP